MKGKRFEAEGIVGKVAICSSAPSPISPLSVPVSPSCRLTP